MWLFSMRFNKRKVAVTVVLAALVVLSVVFFGKLAGAQEETGDPVTITNAMTVKDVKTTAKTEEERAAYLAAFGWELSPQIVAIKEIVIPKPLDAVFEQYNVIQKAQGFDLTKFEGKRVKSYTYEVINYPGQTAEVQATILVYKDKVIAGDVCSIELDGFMHGLQLPE